MPPVLIALADANPVLQQASADAATAETQAADGSPATANRPRGDGFNLMFPVLIIFVLYFMLIRPQQKKEKQRRQMLDKLQRGDHVQTIGGIQGVVASLSDDTAIINVDPKNDATLKVSRSAISRVLGDVEEEKEE